MGLPVGFNDLWFTSDGDYLLSESGDLRDTNDVIGRDETAAIRQFIIHRLLPEEDGWPNTPDATAALERFIGQPLDDATATAMQQTIKAALTFDAILAPSDVDTRVIPIQDGLMAVMIWVRRVSSRPITSFAYDIQQGSVSRLR